MYVMQGIPSACIPWDDHLCLAATPGGNDVTFPVEDLFHKHGVDLAVFGERLALHVHGHL